MLRTLRDFGHAVFARPQPEDGPDAEDAALGATTWDATSSAGSAAAGSGNLRQDGAEMTAGTSAKQG